MPFQGRALLIKETEFGVEPTTPAYLRFSDYVNRVQVGGDPQRTPLRNLDSAGIVDFLNGIEQYTLTVDFDVQRDEQLKDMVVRGADGKLASWSIEVSVNKDQAAVDAYYSFVGAKPNSVTLNSDVGGSLKASVEFFCKDVTIAVTEPAPTGITREAALATAVYSYVTGDLERPASTAFAYITRAWSATINNNLTKLPDVNSATYKAFLEGAIGLEGSADIAVEDGGKAQFDEAMLGTENDLVLYFGKLAGDPLWTFVKAQFPNATFEFGSDSGEVFFDRSWTAKTLTVGDVPA